MMKWFSFHQLSRYIILVIICIFGCQNQSNEGVGLITKPIAEKTSKPVSIFKVQKSNFKQVIYSIGKVYARQKANLHFQLKGPISAVYVKNGQRVEENQLLAKITDSTMLFEESRIKLEIQKAKLEQQSQLLGLGFSYSNKKNIPSQSLTITALNSGMVLLQNELALIKYKLKKTEIYAPFDGIIANLEASEFNQAVDYPLFCTLINDQLFNISFTILESEYTQIRLGQELQIEPLGFEGDPVTGEIVNINPIVEQEGLVQVRAEINEPNSWLMDGLNAKITIMTILKDKIVVPKKAVLNRQDKSLVFIYKDGVAKWTYVTTGFENEKNVIIKSGIQNGQMVIVEGNDGLVHDDKVKLLD